jgi:hypothetical protein
MKAAQRTCLYSFDFPNGKTFEVGEEISEEFVDTPVKLGITRNMTKQEIEKICSVRKNDKTPFDEKDSDDSELEAVRKEYEEKIGEKPHHRKSVETMKAEIGRLNNAG